MDTNQRLTTTLHATILKPCHFSPESPTSPLDPGLATFKIILSPSFTASLPLML
jgi:hypothetical protein